MKKVSGPQVAQAELRRRRPLPAEIQEALGELVGAAREGLLALASASGSASLAELMGARSTRSWARRASTTRTGPRSVTATRTGR